jgi:hypothetical protein
MDSQDSTSNQHGQQRRWAAHVVALRNSGLSRAEYCRRQNLSYHALTYWCRKLSDQGRPATTLVPVSFKREPSAGDISSSQRRGSELAIMLPGDVTVAVGDHFSPATLHRLLAVLGYRR